VRVNPVVPHEVRSRHLRPLASPHAADHLAVRSSRGILIFDPPAPLPAMHRSRIRRLRLLHSCLRGRGLRGRQKIPTGSLPEPVVSDSAGVAIVTLPAGTLSDPDGIRAPFAPDFATGPALTIGVLEGDPAYQFTNPVGAARLNDGTIAVLDRQSRELRFYDADGVHLRTTGGAGDGPGEFRTPASLHHLEGDTLLVLDTQQQRLHWFSPGGDFVRDASGSALGLDTADERCGARRITGASFF
jgi:hypothetical protein